MRWHHGKETEKHDTTKKVLFWLTIIIFKRQTVAAAAAKPLFKRQKKSNGLAWTEQYCNFIFETQGKKLYSTVCEELKIQV